jgi:hypothetical protein
MAGAIKAVEAMMTATKHSRRTAALDDQELQALNCQMLRATWEAGLPTATGVLEALAALPGRGGRLTGQERATTPYQFRRVGKVSVGAPPTTGCRGR